MGAGCRCEEAERSAGREKGQKRELNDGRSPWLTESDKRELIAKWWGLSRLMAVSALLAISAVYVMSCFDGVAYLVDDAFISLNVAYNVLHGHGMARNPGRA